jgi:hypothetical protein
VVKRLGRLARTWLAGMVLAAMVLPGAHRLGAEPDK